MSSHAMGGGLCSCVLYTGAFLYGCGPSQLVAVVAVPICGAQILSDKVSKAWNEKALQQTQDQSSREILKKNINGLEKQITLNTNRTKFFAAGLVPLAGGFLSLKFYGDY